MYCLWKTQGVTVQPWRADLRLGAVRDGETLRLVLSAKEPWTGTLNFDRPRHAENLHLPVDWPRINQFPEWFTVQSSREYLIRGAGSAPRRQTGAELAAGYPLSLSANSELELTVVPAR